MIQTQSQPLKQLFDDQDYAWQLLEGEAKLETSPHVTGDDVSHLLQLYMKGVEKMNSYLDYREAFFKERVMTLMSRPTVMKTLNNKNAMGKKNVTPVATAEKNPSSPEPTATSAKSSSGKKAENSSDLLQLKEKKKQIEVRLAYGVEENTPDLLHKMVDEQSKKEETISIKINQIVSSHEQRLMKRIKERKLKTTVAKSLSNALISNGNNEGSSRDIGFEHDRKAKGKQLTIGSCILLDEQGGESRSKPKNERPYKSLEVRSSMKMAGQASSPLKRSISYNMAVHITRQNIKLWNFNNPI